MPWDKNIKSIIFFIGLSIILINPITYHFWFGEFEGEEFIIIEAGFWIYPLIGILLIVLLKLIPLSSNIQNLIFSFSFLGILYGFILAGNFLIGYYYYPGQTDTSLNDQFQTTHLLPSNTKAHYVTKEFDHMAIVNSLGLRNREINPEKKAETFRILCLGDSFTFGWGVEGESSWPMVLESYLHVNGFTNVEVVNGGQPSYHPTLYKKQLEYYMQKLKPDLVLVGVLQIEDLAQTFIFNHGKTAQTYSIENDKPVSLFEYFKEHSFSNLINLTRNIRNREIEATAQWQHENGRIIKDFSLIQKVRFESLPDTVRSLFHSGDLNPGLLEYYIYFNDMITIFNNPDNPYTQFAIDILKQCCIDMKQICTANGSKLVFINLPIAELTGHSVENTPFNLNTLDYKNIKIDSLYQSVAEEAQIPYFELTEIFMDLEEKDKYFFTFDRHPNEYGQEVIGQNTGEYLIMNSLLE